MKPSLDEIVITDGNREAFELVIGATQSKVPINAYIYGEPSSGKTFVMQARAADKDLLSTKKAIFTHAAELMTAIQFESGDNLLEQAGSVDVLFLDAFDLFFQDIPAGPLLCKLLVIERQSHGLSTIINGKKPLEDYDLSLLGGSLDSFDQIEVKPLDKADYVDLAKKEQAFLAYGKDNPVTLSAEALDFVALKFAKTPKDIHSALRFLFTVADYPAGTVIDLNELKIALGQ